jgi:hypothetical protein
MAHRGPPRPAKRADGNTMRYVILGFLVVYGVGQLALLGQSTGVLGGGAGGARKGGGARAGGGGGGSGGGGGGGGGGDADAAAAGLRGLSTDGVSGDGGGAGAGGAVVVGAAAAGGAPGAAGGGGSSAYAGDAGAALKPFVYDQVEELPFPAVELDDGGVPIFDVVPRAVVEAADARQALLDGRSKADRDKGGKYDSTPVTVNVPCWTDARLLWRMGLDAMAADMEAGRVPRDTRRSRTPHAFAPLAADLTCTFHSTPISGGLQCCCTSNMTSPFAAGPSSSAGAPDPGTFFCLPSAVIVGGRATGAGLLAAFFQQHAYLRYARTPPPHVMSAPSSLYVVDSVMPRYLSAFAPPAMLPSGFSALPRDGRAKAVSPWFWIDASPSYLYSVTAPVLLRKLLPRSKVIVVLRDPVERAYVDLTAALARRGRRAAEAALAAAIHACAKAAACDEAPGAAAGVGGLTPGTWAAGAGAAFEACLLARVAAAPAVAALDGAASPASVVSCVSRAVRPGAPADWAAAYAGAADAAGGPAAVAPCGAGDGAVDGEAPAVWARVQAQYRPQVFGCLDGPDAALPAAFVPKVDDLIEAVAAAEARLSECSIEVPPGTAIPVPVDLMAANVNGYELGLFAVAGELPRETPGPARVVLDGDKDGCYPDGVDVDDDPGAPLARSAYLRPLQRLHAAYGRKPVLVYDTATLRTDPGGILDPVFESLSVYKPVLDPVQARTDCRLSGWTGELGECDVRVPVMDERVKAKLTAALEPYSRAFKAYLAAAPVGGQEE